ncbi:MAG: hypothetical protein WCX17_04755 [Parcubacteria group bacterium]
MSNLVNFIKNNLFDSKGLSSRRANKQWLLKHHPETYNLILELTSFIDTTDISRRLYHIYNNMWYVPKCPVCDINVDFLGFAKNYRIYCSRKCSAIVRGGAMIKPKKIKILKTREEINEKRKQTCLLKYGVEHHSQSKSIKNKTIETNLIRYGTLNPGQNEKIKDKIKQTCLEKYGVDNPFKSKSVQQKIKNNTDQDQRSKSIELTYINRLIKKWPAIVNKFNQENYIVLNDPSEFRKTNMIRYTCPHGHNHVTNLGNWTKGVRCVYCKDPFRSNHETEIKNFLESYGVYVECNRRYIIPPYEIDIFLPDHKIAIEIDGIFWHNDSFKDKNYHLMKTELCTAKDIYLIHVFEDEWLYKQEIVKSMILSKLGIFDRMVDARQCEVRNVDNRSDFLDANHIQGNCISSINFGLYYDNELISVMTFGNSNKLQWEMLRFCNKLNTQVISGASKLFQYFTANYNIDKITSYIDRRWSNGNLHKQIGFKLNSVSDINYSYIINKNREPRYNWRKDILPEKLIKFDSSLSEWQNMQANGYNRIWDCGNYVFNWSK